MRNDLKKEIKKLPRNSEHHIIPRSRAKNLRKNTVKINRKQHEHYHTLFENRTPEEIIEFLNSYFWGNKYKIVITK